MANSWKEWSGINKKEPLIGASVYWQGTQEGTTTDEEGKFKIKVSTSSNKLVVQYLGHETREYEIINPGLFLDVRLQSFAMLEQVEVRERGKDEELSILNTVNSEVLGRAALEKDPCCSLAESFESNASVNLDQTNAVLGTKEIEMLGLRGIYTQLLIENRPAFEGILNSSSLHLVPVR